MVWLPDSKKLKICLLMSTQYMKVTDGRTDGRTGGQTPYDGKVEVLCFRWSVSKCRREKRTNETDARSAAEAQQRRRRSRDEARLSPTLTIDCFVFGARRVAVAIGILSWPGSDVVVSRPSRPGPDLPPSPRRPSDRLRDAEERVGRASVTVTRRHRPPTPEWPDAPPTILQRHQLSAKSRNDVRLMPNRLCAKITECLKALKLPEVLFR